MIARTLLSASITVLALGAAAEARDADPANTRLVASSPDDRELAGRKTVTVYADSEAEAFAEANRKHPGWTATKAKKTGGGRAYQVTMVKE